MTNQSTNIRFMDAFPDFRARGFNEQEYNQRFRDHNIIIHAKAKSVYFPEHWGGLSVKTVLKGTEHYQAGNARYAVDENTYLLFNEGKYYSSWIESDTEVESFTLNFASDFSAQVFHSIRANHRAQLADQTPSVKPIRFTEKLYVHQKEVTPLIERMRVLSANLGQNERELHYLFVLLLERLVQQQSGTDKQVEALDKMKRTTRMELFDRLTRAKDFIYSCYAQDLSLAEVANVACLNQYYFLRQFKKAFRATPHQVLMQRRLAVAASLLQNGDQSIAEVGFAVGMQDASSFSKLFKKTYGVSPLIFRESRS